MNPKPFLADESSLKELDEKTLNQDNSPKVTLAVAFEQAIREGSSARKVDPMAATDELPRPSRPSVANKPMAHKGERPRGHRAPRRSLFALLKSAIAGIRAHYFVILAVGFSLGLITGGMLAKRPHPRQAHAESAKAAAKAERIKAPAPVERALAGAQEAPARILKKKPMVAKKVSKPAPQAVRKLVKVAPAPKVRAPARKAVRRPARVVAAKPVKAGPSKRSRHRGGPRR